MEEKDRVAESHIKIYFDCEVTAFTTVNSLEYYPAFPWRFSIKHEGKVREYSGMPNYVETKRRAWKRGWYRAKWLSEKTYFNRYSVTSIVRG